MSDYEFITSTGTVVADTSQTQEQVIQDLVEALGISEEAARDSSTTEGRFVEYITTIRRSTANNNALLSNQINPNLAEDGYFDALYALFGGERDAATQSSADCDLTGVPGTIINQGSFIRNSVTSTLWELSSGVILDVNGEATATFFSQDTGPVTASVGELDQIVSGVVGWETVTNPSIATEGRDEQSLVSAKLSRAKQLATNSNSTVGSVLSAVLNLDNVIEAQARENRTNSTQDIDGILIPAKSTWLCVDGGSINDIAAQYVINTHGTNFYGFSNTEIGQYTDPISGQVYGPSTIPVNIDRPTDVPIKIEVTASLISSTDLITQIKEAVNAWADGLIDGYKGASLGNDISPFEISAALNQYFSASDIFVSKVRITKVSDDDLQFDTLDINLWEKTSVSDANIIVIQA